VRSADRAGAMTPTSSRPLAMTKNAPGPSAAAAWRRSGCVQRRAGGSAAQRAAAPSAARARQAHGAALGAPGYSRSSPVPESPCAPRSIARREVHVRPTAPGASAAAEHDRVRPTPWGRAQRRRRRRFHTWRPCASPSPPSAGGGDGDGGNDAPGVVGRFPDQRLHAPPDGLRARCARQAREIVEMHRERTVDQGLQDRRPPAAMETSAAAGRRACSGSQGWQDAEENESRRTAVISRSRSAGGAAHHADDVRDDECSVILDCSFMFVQMRAAPSVQTRHGRLPSSVQRPSSPGDG